MKNSRMVPARNRKSTAFAGLGPARSSTVLFGTSARALMLLLMVFLASACQNPFSRPLPETLDLNFVISLGSSAARSLSAPADFAGKRLTVRLQATSSAGQPGTVISSFTTVLQEPSSAATTISVPVTFNAVPTRMDLILTGSLSDTDSGNTVYYTAQSSRFQASWTSAAEVNLPFTKTSFPANAKAITSFGFRRSLNPGLSQDYQAVISGTAISLELPEGTLPSVLEDLIPTFAHTGQTVIVAGSPQQSSLTGVNFSSSSGVVYLVSAADSSSASYTVSLSISGYQPAGTITFNANGGAGTMAVQSLANGETANLSPLGFTRLGYTFSGWNTQADGLGTSYADQASFAMGASGITLYAIWAPISYSINFLPALGTGTMAPQAVNYDQAVTLTANGFSRVGHSFAGWSLSAGGALAYADGASYTHTLTADLDLYALWTPDSYTLSFDAQDGTEPVPLSKTVTYGQGYGPLASTTRAGFIFSGWWTEENGSGSEVLASDLFSLTEDQTLYAYWAPGTGTIVFNANGGAGTMANQSLDTGNTANLNPVSFTRLGYTFVSWNTQADGLGTSYANQASFTMGPSSVTLYAIWNLDTYTINYLPNEGTGTMTPQPVNYNQTLVLTGNAFSRPGHRFDGWSLSAGGPVVYADGENYTHTLAGNRDLYAIWVELGTLTVTVTVFNPASVDVSFSGPAVLSQSGRYDPGIAANLPSIMTVNATGGLGTYHWLLDGLSSHGAMTVNPGALGPNFVEIDSTGLDKRVYTLTLILLDGDDVPHSHHISFAVEE